MNIEPKCTKYSWMFQFVLPKRCKDQMQGNIANLKENITLLFVCIFDLHYQNAQMNFRSVNLLSCVACFQMEPLGHVVYPISDCIGNLIFSTQEFNIHYQATFSSL